MEKVKRHSLKTEFITAVAVALLAISGASALTVWGCWAVRSRLLPDPNSVILQVESTSPDGEETQKGRYEIQLDGEAEPVFWMFHEWNKPDIIDDPDIEVGMADFSIESITPSVSQLRSSEQALYQAAGVLMIAFPVLYSITGILLCAMWFYKKKLLPAITALDDAAQHISEQDLDFTVTCDLKNELGRLCASFEQMRQSLYDNNLRLWRTIEERRTMQASVAHDLRNPMAIMAGYVEYMQQALPSGALCGEKLERTLRNLEATTKRMERYTDYIRDLDAIEDTEERPGPVPLPDFLRNAADSVRMLGETRQLQFLIDLDIPACVVDLDRAIFFRVLENVCSNAVRYAETTISLTFTLSEESLSVKVYDDGKGFSEQMLHKKNSLYYSEDLTGEHMGLGLATSKILCEKHGGWLKLANCSPHGAVVEAAFAVKRR